MQLFNSFSEKCRTQESAEYNAMACFVPLKWRVAFKVLNGKVTPLRKEEDFETCFS